MRPIKFRGKRVDNGEWVYGYYVEEDCSHLESPFGSTRYAILAGNLLIAVDPKTVGQFTRSQDNKRTEEYSEGQEIYDGDNIVCRKYIGGNFVEYSIEKGIVSFKDGAFYLLREQGYYRPLSWLIEMDYELEVIGNVWDNPELVGDGPAEPA
jgi:hypothetical protein